MTNYNVYKRTIVESTSHLFLLIISPIGTQRSIVELTACQVAKHNNQKKRNNSSSGCSLGTSVSLQLFWKWDLKLQYNPQ